MKSSRKLLALSAIVAITVTIGLLISPSLETTKPPAERIKLIQNLNDRACMCAMANRSSIELENALRNETAGLKVEGLGSASLPMTGSVRCFPELGDQACIGRIELVADSSIFVCNSEQAEVLEIVWNRAKRRKGATIKTGDAALIAHYETMRADLRRTLPEATCKLP